MENRTSKLTTAACAATVLLFSAGCATTDLEAVRAELQSVKDMSASAMADAEAARTEAGEASRTANRVLSAAREAQAMGAANSERIDRMFEKAMVK